MLRRLIVIVSFIFSVSLAHAENNLRILSDIDDTVRISHVGSPGSIARALFSNRAFAGMATLYTRLLKTSEGTNLYFASGTPDILSWRVRVFLNTNQFPSSEMYLQNTLRLGDVYRFKMDVLGKLMADLKNATYLALGDDTEADPLVYRDLDKNFSGQILHTYIHIIKDDKEIPKGQSVFYSAFDIALNEVKEGRLSVEDATEVGSEVLMTDDYEKIIPEFAVCPSEDWLDAALVALKPEDQKSLSELTHQIEGAVSKFCKERSEAKAIKLVQPEQLDSYSRD
jgi:hypothetical protein